MPCSTVWPTGGPEALRTVCPTSERPPCLHVLLQESWRESRRQSRETCGRTLAQRSEPVSRAPAAAFDRALRASQLQQGNADGRGPHRPAARPYAPLTPLVHLASIILTKMHSLESELIFLFTQSA